MLSFLQEIYIFNPLSNTLFNTLIEYHKSKLTNLMTAYSKAATELAPPRSHLSKSRSPGASQTTVKGLKSLPPKLRSKSESLKPDSFSDLVSSRIEVPVAQSTPAELRSHFLRNLALLTGPPVSLINDIDDSSPPVSFNFVNSSIIGEGVQTVEEGFMIGCNCRDENGRNCGCEYRTCSCLQHSAKDESGNHHFPYSASKLMRGCLRSFYLNSRHHIYECNKNCNCRDNCKNKVVQHGRQVPLEIFKTENRGWGTLGFTVGIPMLMIGRFALSSGSSKRPIH